jgi:hypothetical protein
MPNSRVAFGRVDYEQVLWQWSVNISFWFLVPHIGEVLAETSGKLRKHVSRRQDKIPLAGSLGFLIS